MALLGFTLLVSMVMSNHHPYASSRSRALEGHAFDATHLRQLIEQLQGNTARRQESFDRRTVEDEGDCTGDILQGYQWYGDQVMSMGGVDTVQRCMDNCDIKKECMGWSYKAESHWCWGMNNIKGVLTFADVKSGSCVGTNLKARCTDSRVGWYSGNYQSAGKTNSAKDCMNACSAKATCFGWYFEKSGTQCYFSQFVGEFSSSYNWLVSGACLAKQVRTQVGDPLKIFRQESLERHNDKRKLHCVPALEQDDDLNEEAQEFADELAAADDTPADYDVSTMQTVFFNKGDPAAHGSAVVDSFYDEGLYYNYTNPQFWSTNHFPKVIWKSSTKMGVGRAFTNDKKTMFIVTKYDWQGDITKSYRTNVLRKCM